MNKGEKLNLEINDKTKEFKTDNYPMSIGELSNLYTNNELQINPDFQRYYRWSHSQKTRLIESILLGIPIPNIFVYERGDGIWELVDGLQRVSTILQFMGVLKDYPPLELEKTKLVPELEGCVWKEADSPDIFTLPDSLKLQYKRSKLYLSIIKKDSDKDSKYEVFQRLNTGGSFASNQEVRNCTMVMVDKEKFEWLSALADNQNFKSLIALAPRYFIEQYEKELILRYFSCLYVDYNRKTDVSSFLDQGMEYIMHDNFDMIGEKDKFDKVVSLLYSSTNSRTFKKYDAEKAEFKGGFLESAFEAIMVGMASNLDSYKISDKNIIEDKIKNLWSEPVFRDNVGSGTNAKTRIPNIIPFSKTYFKNE